MGVGLEVIKGERVLIFDTVGRVDLEVDFL